MLVKVCARHAFENVTGADNITQAASRSQPKLRHRSRAGIPVHSEREDNIMREHTAEAIKDVLDDYKINKKADPARVVTHFNNMEEEINNIRKVLFMENKESNEEDIKELDQMVHLLRNGKVPASPVITEVQ
ncbi:hypothetical protein IRL25_000462 [Salmonella enterica]|nr:hypothetical protein [Salmonella enterica]